MYQLKGPKNSKPKEEYYQYILPLFYVKSDDGYLIQGFGNEYQSDNDFKLTDLPDPLIRHLFQNRPELFETSELTDLPELVIRILFQNKPELFHTFESQKKLVEMGLIDETSINFFVRFKINTSEINVK